MKILEVVKVSKRFGGLKALNDVTFHIIKGEIFGIIGPNGAGKTTLFNVISGAFGPTNGDVIFKGENVTGLSMHKVARKGLVRTFQASTVWKEETVLDNVLLASYLHRDAGLTDWFRDTEYSQREQQNLLEKAEKVLHHMKLAEIKEELSMNLPHGKMRALGICIALMTDPEVILLDEPVTGMNPVEKLEMMELLRGLSKKGLTIAIIEHDMATVMNLVERILVLNHGEVIAEGPPNEIKANQSVIEAYLGSGKEN